MDRRIIYSGAVPYDTDLLGAEKWALEGLASLAALVLGGSAPVVSGLTVGPNSPPGLSVVVQPGSIYAPLPLDATAYGVLSADSHVVMQQGLLRDAVVLAITPPGTTGQSRVYLVQAACQVIDTDPSVLPYFNAANPTVALTGPGNSGTPQNTRRSVVATINLKAGTPAATGTQVAPTVDAGWTALALVTVANGATTITSGNIVASPGPNVDPLGLNLGIRPGRLISTQTITATGNVVVPAGATAARVTLIGAGGGTGYNANWAGAGGGSGGRSIKLITGLVPGASIACTVGAGGAAPSGSPGVGGVGGTTSFGAYCSATGGGPGSGNSNINAGGAPGGGVGGDFNDYGAFGGDSIPLGQRGGDGGGPGQGRATTGFNTGFSALGYGGGGGGGGSSNINGTGAGASGGVGCQGVIFVEWFS